LSDQQDNELPLVSDDVSYSKAFEQLVDKPGDIRGLVAYALYKQTLRDRRRLGLYVTPSSDRALAPSEIETFRSRAIEILKGFGDVLIAEAQQDIVKTGVLTITDRLKDHITARTSPWSALGWAFIAGVAAWIFSLALTVLIALQAPDKAQYLAKILGLSH
jgi:hypothetical protein